MCLPLTDTRRPANTGPHATALPPCAATASTDEVAPVSSVDGGVTWHPATGRATWRFEWKPGGDGGEVKVLSRAVDDSGNLEVAGEG